MVMNDGTYLLV